MVWWRRWLVVGVVEKVVGVVDVVVQHLEQNTNSYLKLWVARHQVFLDIP